MCLNLIFDRPVSIQLQEVTSAFYCPREAFKNEKCHFVFREQMQTVHTEVDLVISVVRDRDGHAG